MEPIFSREFFTRATVFGSVGKGAAGPCRVRFDRANKTKRRRRRAGSRTFLDAIFPYPKLPLSAAAPVKVHDHW